MPPKADLTLVGFGAVDWPDPPPPGTPPDPAALVGARTDADLYAALKTPPGHDPDAPVFVLFGSSWCTHCHALLQSFDAAREQYTGGGGGGAGDGQQRRRRGGWLPWSRRRPAAPPPASTSAPRFVAATVDYMADAALDVRYTPTVAVYRRGSRVDAWHGADGGKLADRVWLWAGARRAAVVGGVVSGGSGGDR